MQEREDPGNRSWWHPEVVVLDLDGVVTWRIPCQKAGIPIIGQHDPGKYAQAIREVPVALGPSDEALNLGTYFSAGRHLLSPVFPDVARVIKGLDPGIVIFGNTGRSDKLPVVNATWESLALAGLDGRFRLIYFKPDGQETVEHKVAVTGKIAKQYGEKKIVVADDNPYDLLPQAARFPGSRFILIRDLTTRKLLGGINMATEYPNVVIARTLRQGISVAMTLNDPVFGITRLI